jgi:hypothetical protein
MATVGSSSAYAVRPSSPRGDLDVPMALSDKILCLYVGVWGGTDRDHCCAKKALWPGLVICLPVASRYVYATRRVLIGWHR